MSKKQKRSVTQSSSPVPRSTVSPSTATFVPVSESRTTTPSRSSSAEFNPDYTYIIKDLKRIGVLAGSFFAILIILSFFLK